MRRREIDQVEKKDCFGSIQEVTLETGVTQTSAKPECRNCEELRDCLRYGKQLAEEKRERDEMRKQNMIAKVIDHSVILSNEFGTCLLEFLNRIYRSSLGEILFRTLLLFCEVPKDLYSMPMTIPISSDTFDLPQGQSIEAVPPDQARGVHQPQASKGKFFIRIVLIQRTFSNNRKANLGLIAREVARAFSADDHGLGQIRETLNDSEWALFKKMDERQRIQWLLTKWGFQEEFTALKQELSSVEGKRPD